MVEETGQGVACRILEVQQEEEDVFKGDLNFLVLKDNTLLSYRCNREVRQPPSEQGAVDVRQTAGDGGV